MRVRKCKSCNGKGFVFSKSYSIKENRFGFGLQETGIKIPCLKCFGKGVK
ncbi:TPA: hypothetical protein QCW13_005068 [Bacillus cereus]|nr:hypothetical protein [Bacillus cereus]HDR7020889.1 hypothetical protein [Bacillus cereus]